MQEQYRTSFGCLKDGDEFSVTHGVEAVRFVKTCRGHGKQLDGKHAGQVCIFVSDSEVKLEKSND